jgi:hypothetical protein
MSDTPRERYNRDPKFRQLVDVQVHLIRECQFSPTEMREAATLACILHEEHHVPLTSCSHLRSAKRSLIGKGRME